MSTRHTIITTPRARWCVVGFLAWVTLCGNALAKPKKELRPIRIVVYELDVLKGVEIDSGALTDQINTMFSAMPKVTIVNREQIEKVAKEHQISLTGLVDTTSAVRLGKILSAQHIVVGRASRIGHTDYLVLKIVDVETTVQKTVSAKASVEDGFSAVLERLGSSLEEHVQDLQRGVADPDDEALAKVRQAAKPLAGKTVALDISEEHVNRPLRDPAARMAAAKRLEMLGIKVLVPKDPRPGWKEALMKTGKYSDQKVDYLLEGEGVSAYAARIQDLISCRARVELRLIAVPGRTITVSDKGVAAGVDLVEPLAAKAALEDAAVDAVDAVILGLAARDDVPKR